MPSTSGPLTGTTALANATGQESTGFVQNLSTNPLFVCLGLNGDATTNYHYVLAACSAQDAGDGGTISFDNYLGPVSVAGTSKRYVAWWQ